MGGGPLPLGDNERFEIKSCLGAGAMGVVFRARDRERNVDVALKLLRNVDPAAIYRFKREFRALADVLHPNLVPLYELISTGDQWFFTMELIVGTDFLAAVRGVSADPLGLRPLGLRRPEDPPDSEEPTTGATSSLVRTRELDGPASDSPDAQPRRVRRHLPPLSEPEQFQRLRAALVQLADGIRALHRAGQLHRDIKPSNVLVTPEGRVVLLDFGVVAALAEQEDVYTTARIIGTPAYMAPEQAVGSPLTEASDWYAVGVMMYEALAGTLPFQGDIDHIVTAKRTALPPPPGRHGARVPPDLEDLCMRLLSRDPAERPLGRDLRQALGGASTGPLPVVSRRATAGQVPLVGRERELDELRSAFTQIGAGRTVCVHLSGASGMGKSALASAFLAELSAGQQALVLRGRCYERESVPYKALDSLIDALAHYLTALPQQAVAEMLPASTRALARLFPALRRVAAVVDKTVLAPESPDPHQRRRKAFSALRELLRELSARNPLVLHVDDLQWGDPDSAALLAEVLRPPRSPALLLIAGYRSEDAETSPFLRSFLPAHPDAVQLPVEPLTETHAHAMAAALLVDADDTARAQVAAIARESGGNPFFITELVQFVRSTGRGQSLIAGQSVSLEEVLRTRLHSLPEGASRLLEIVAVAGRPIAQELAMHAAELGATEQATVALLRGARLVWTSGARTQDAVEILHDRIRNAVIGDMPPDTLRACHARLARALEHSADADPEALATHLEGAGEIERAASCFASAADNAMRALAFGRAAALYHRALDLGASAAPHSSELWAKLGEALANAGHAAAAAGAFLQATEQAGDSDALRYRVRAAEAHLHCGQIDSGVEGLNRVASAVGIDAPATPRGALLSLLGRRTWLRLRGLHYEQRDRESVDDRHLAQLEICSTASAGYGMFDPIRGADFQTRSLLLALRAGEPSLLSRALVAEACYTASVGRRGARRGRKLMDEARALAETAGDGTSIGLVDLGEAVMEYLFGRWQASRVASEKGLRLLRERPAGLAWELENVQLFHLWTLFYLGRINELCREVPRLLREARARGDLFGVANLSTGLPNVAWLAEDRPDEARHVAREAMKRWSLRGFHLLHYREMVTLTNAALYEGDGRAALEPVLERWRSLKRSLLLRVAIIRNEGRALRARCHLAAAASGYDRAARMRTADREGRRVARSGEAWAVPLGLMVRAGVACTRKQEVKARDLFETAASAFEEQGMSMHVAAAQRRIGLLVGGDEGAALVAAADARMTAQGIAKPERFTAMLAP